MTLKELHWLLRLFGVTKEKPKRLIDVANTIRLIIEMKTIRLR